MEKELNHLLADLVVEYHKLQNFHWYVKGKDFFMVHAKLEEYYNAVNEKIDEVAESILMLNARPIASIKGFLKETSIEEAENTFTSSETIFKEMIRDFRSLLSEAEDIRKSAEEKGNPAVSALMDDYISYFTKAIWMLNQQFA